MNLTLSGGEKIFGFLPKELLIAAAVAFAVCVVVYIIFFKKINALIVKHKEIVLYIVFGALTTLVNFIIYYPLVNIKAMEPHKEWWVLVVNVIAWIAAVAFAFVTNKLFVFESKERDKKTLLVQITSFVGSRLFSLLVEEGILALFVSLLKFSENIWKLVAAAFVVIMNYFFGKFLVFRNKKDKKEKTADGVTEDQNDIGADAPGKDEK